MFIKLFTLMLAVSGVWSAVLPENRVETAARTTGDLATAETSAKLFNLFGTGTGYPNYGYNYNRPTTGYYPGYNTNYYGSSGYYPGSGYGSTYYPSYGTNTYYSTQGYNYPTSSYPTTNILGSQGGYGGYGGYGGNGGLRQYSGYWQRDYQGQRNRGYGYYDDTDRYGLPLSRDRAYGSNSYRGYN
ncbi:prisilkin-39 isoform X1 [Drosophila ficusphila]|uniref:prisilkin-39 isoform X1 n=1 Tax=Drosophila ficusphila TaxID=30025 RepID=UPI0007E60D67|nr:prisilkin-39 isoform X1 [Drosophila ficusphila]